MGSRVWVSFWDSPAFSGSSRGFRHPSGTRGEPPEIRQARPRAARDGQLAVARPGEDLDMAKLRKPPPRPEASESKEAAAAVALTGAAAIGGKLAVDKGPRAGVRTRALTGLDRPSSCLTECAGSRRPARRRRLRDLLDV